jgi:hypothetical protein
MKSIFHILLSLLVSGTAFAQVNTPPMVDPPGGNLLGDNQGVMFERQLLDFASQGVDQENCTNLPILNNTNRPQMLTGLASRDPHFVITSPSEQMLPVIIPPQGSLYIAVCFKSHEAKSFQSQIVARLSDDSVVLVVKGAAVPLKMANLPPTATTFEAASCGKRSFDLKASIARRSTVLLQVTNSLGYIVRTYLANEVKTPGRYEVRFDGKDETGAKLPAGKYIARFEAKDVETKEEVKRSKTIVLK